MPGEGKTKWVWLLAVCGEALLAENLFLGESGSFVRRITCPSSTWPFVNGVLGGSEGKSKVKQDCDGDLVVESGCGLVPLGGVEETATAVKEKWYLPGEFLLLLSLTSVAPALS